MMLLPKEIRGAVRASEGRPIRLVEPETNNEYVLLPAELYDQARDFFYEHSTLSPEKRALMVQAGLRAGWDDPEMEVYNVLDPRR